MYIYWCFKWVNSIIWVLSTYIHIMDVFRLDFQHHVLCFGMIQMFIIWVGWWHTWLRSDTTMDMYLHMYIQFMCFSKYFGLPSTYRLILFFFSCHYNKKHGTRYLPLSVVIFLLSFFLFYLHMTLTKIRLEREMEKARKKGTWRAASLLAKLLPIGLPCT